MKKLYVVIPCYNEEEVLNETAKRLEVKMNSMIEEDLISKDSRVVLVNDGSKDRTWEMIEELHEKNPLFSGINLSRNRGHQNALLAGLMTVKDHCDVSISMDADLQDPPDMLPEMIEILENEDYDCVGTRRTNRKGEPPIRSFFARMFYKLINKISDTEIVDGARDFRVMTRQMVDAILSMTEYNRFSKGIFSWIGFKEKVIEYENQVRTVGETKYSLRFSLNYAIQGILSFNDKPLRMCINLGLFCLMISVAYVLWSFVQYFVAPDTMVSGYFTTIFSVVLFGGIQLISIGVLGEYIGKIYYEVKKRPHYLVDQTNMTQKGEQNDN